MGEGSFFCSGFPSSFEFGKTEGIRWDQNGIWWLSSMLYMINIRFFFKQSCLFLFCFVFVGFLFGGGGKVNS